MPHNWYLFYSLTCTCKVGGWWCPYIRRCNWKTISQNRATHTQTLLTGSTQTVTKSAVAFQLLCFNLLSADAVISSYSKHGGQGVPRPALMVRGALLMTSYLLALLVPRFSLLMGLTGSVTGAAMTLILPCLFHLRLQWSRLTVRERLIDVCILSLGVICSVSGVVCSVTRLVEGL